MRFFQAYSRAVQRIFPSPFVIAILLTLVVFLAAWLWGTEHNSIQQLGASWVNGMWSKGGLAFLVQMMLMLVLGHILALTQPANAVIQLVLKRCINTQQSVFWVCLISLLFSWINWGLGLIIAAILARKVGGFFAREKKQLNYPLVGASAYAGMMFWHGGLSGSAPLKVAETGHLMELMSNSTSLLPQAIPINETVLSHSNLVLSCIMLVGLPLGLRFLAPFFGKGAVPEFPKLRDHQNAKEHAKVGMERLDLWKPLGMVVGLSIVFLAVFQLTSGGLGWGGINPNWINTLLLGAALFFHKSIHQFVKAAEEAIQGSTGILLQFPLYFGIMGLMKDSGLIATCSEFFVSISSEQSFPFLAFFSAGLVNLFVPSGGGQWMVQGPIIIQACLDFGIPLKKGVMALAYGDQLTNMLQPFWALPLLGITGLKAKSIIPYTLLLFGIGLIAYSITLFWA